MNARVSQHSCLLHTVCSQAQYRRTTAVCNEGLCSSHLLGIFAVILLIMFVFLLNQYCLLAGQLMQAFLNGKLLLCALHQDQLLLLLLGHATMAPA